MKGFCALLLAASMTGMVTAKTPQSSDQQFNRQSSSEQGLLGRYLLVMDAKHVIGLQDHGFLNASIARSDIDNIDHVVFHGSEVNSEREDLEPASIQPIPPQPGDTKLQFLLNDDHIRMMNLHGLQYIIRPEERGKYSSIEVIYDGPKTTRQTTPVTQRPDFQNGGSTRDQNHDRQNVIGPQLPDDWDYQSTRQQQQTIRSKPVPTRPIQRNQGGAFRQPADAVATRRTRDDFEGFDSTRSFNNQRSFEDDRIVDRSRTRPSYLQNSDRDFSRRSDFDMADQSARQNRGDMWNGGDFDDQRNFQTTQTPTHRQPVLRNDRRNDPNYVDPVIAQQQRLLAQQEQELKRLEYEELVRDNEALNYQLKQKRLANGDLDWKIAKQRRDLEAAIAMREREIARRERERDLDVADRRRARELALRQRELADRARYSETGFDPDDELYVDHRRGTYSDTYRRESVDFRDLDQRNRDVVDRENELADRRIARSPRPSSGIPTFSIPAPQQTSETTRRSVRSGDTRVIADADRIQKQNAALWFIMLCSVGLNFYLAWIARGFYVRYEELADELRETFTSTMS